MEGYKRWLFLLEDKAKRRKLRAVAEKNAQRSERQSRNG